MRDLCRRLNISKEQGEEIINSQFRKVKNVMEEYSLEDENFPAIRLINFGSFFVKQSKKRSNDGER